MRSKSFALPYALLIAATFSFAPANAQSLSASYQAGVQAMALNDMQKAIYNFDQAVTNDGTDWRSFLKRGQCLYQLGDYKLAIADFNQVLTTKPRNSDALLWRGNSYAKLQQPDKALNDYKQVLSFDPIKIAVLSQKATFTSTRQAVASEDESSGTTSSAASSGSSTSAESTSSGSTASSSGSTAAAPPAALHLRPALFASGNDPNKEIDELNTAISIDPKNPQLLFKRAKALIQLKKNDSAVNDLSDAIMNNPNNASYYLARALVYHLLGNDVLAVEDIHQAQFCDPGLPKTIDFESSKSSDKKS